MTENSRSILILRRVIAILAGALVGIVLSIGADAALRAIGLFPSEGQPMAGKLLALAAAYRTVYTAGGAYVGAWLAPDRPMWHAMLLGYLALAANLVGTVATWNRGPAFGPHWYPLTLVLLAVPSCWAGGKIRIAKSDSRAQFRQLLDRH